MREPIDPLDGWLLKFNAFSAGQDWGRKHPNPTTGEVIAACSAYADSIFPHECPSPEPEVTRE